MDNRRSYFVSILLFGLLGTHTLACGQAPASKAASGAAASSALGEVTAVDPANRRLSLKTGDGNITIYLSDDTKFLRVQPGEKSLEKAETITLADVAVGDRVLARGKVSKEEKSVIARQVIVMSKAAIAQKQERDREEWNRRGISGTISGINSTTKEVTVTTRSREGIKPLVITAGDKVSYRRYAPDSVKFTDAKPSSFSELKIGDQVRALGEKSADGAHFLPEIIVSGSFMMAGGAITNLNPATGEITINNIPTQKPLTVVVNKDTVLRRIPHDLAVSLAQRVQGASVAGSAQPAGAQRGASLRVSRPQTAGASEPMPAGTAGRAAGPSASSGDVQELLERLPPIRLADLQAGDAILVSSTVGADPSRVTAIALASGIEPLLVRAQQGPARPGMMAGASLGLPSGVLDFGVGLPPN